MNEKLEKSTEKVNEYKELTIDEIYHEISEKEFNQKGATK